MPSPNIHDIMTISKNKVTEVLPNETDESNS